MSALRASAFWIVLFIAFGLLDKHVLASAESSKDAYIRQLELTLAKCLSAGDHPVKIGDEIWFCGATNIGVKVK